MYLELGVPHKTKVSGQYHVHLYASDNDYRRLPLMIKTVVQLYEAQIGDAVIEKELHKMFEAGILYCMVKPLHAKKKTEMVLYKVFKEEN